MHWLENSLPSVDLIYERLKIILPRELDPEGFILREMGAKSIFVMLYCFCIDKNNWIRPATITCMSDAQAKIIDKNKRIEWLEIFQSRKAPKDVIERWYMPNTREPIRDETLRNLVRLGVVIEKDSLPTTSPLPRYCLQNDFSELFNPFIKGEQLNILIAGWRNKYLTAAALARIALSKKMITNVTDGVLIKLPNGEVRKITPGPSSELIKAVIEVFSVNFLKEPAAILISESARKIIMQDEELCRAVGFNIDVSTVLPDIILVDLGASEPLVVFVECVATDGPVSERRKQELIKISNDAGYDLNNCAFVTVFKDRTDKINRIRFPSIAWDTFVWYATEPNSIIYLREGKEEKLNYLIDFLR